LLFVVQMTDHANVLTDEPEQRSLEIGDERIDFDDAGLKRLPAAKCEELSSENGGTTGSAANLGDMAGNRALPASLGEDQVAVAEDGGEEIVEIVRDTARELTEGFHFLRTTKLIM